MKILTGLVAITVLVLAAALFFNARVASAYEIEIRNEADYDARVWSIPICRSCGLQEEGFNKTTITRQGLSSPTP